MVELTYELASRLLRADFETGRLFWLERTPDLFLDEEKNPDHACARWNGRFAGAEAFVTSEDGYRRGWIYGRGYKAHRVIWLLAYGEWPNDQIDHINGIRDDNRLVNLRMVTNAENNRNRRVRSDSKTGVIGVYFGEDSKKWIARIKTQSGNKHLGSFDSLEAAAAARRRAEIKYGYHPNHGRAG